MKTVAVKQKDIQKNWYIVDLKDQVLGRAAAHIAHVLKGKHKPTYTPHLDMGDNVIVINAKDVKLTGRKWDQKMYYRHTGYMGGLKETNAAKQHEKDPTFIITKAVKGMLSRGPLARQQLKNLRVYAGAEHPHEGQEPKSLEIS